MITEITFKEALVDAIRFYSEDPSRRSCIAGDRIYMQEDGHKCAIGRYIRPGQEEVFHSFDVHEKNGNIETVVNAYQVQQRKSGRWIGEKEAIAELVNINDATLDDLVFLQILHDEDGNWDSGGLSEFGRETIKQFRPDLYEDVLKETQNVIA